MTDLISRDEAVQAINSGVEYSPYEADSEKSTAWCVGGISAVKAAEEAIRSLPSVQPVDPAAIRAEALRECIGQARLLVDTGWSSYNVMMQYPPAVIECVLKHLDKALALIEKDKT